jgi:hypothetical protein
MMMCQINNKDSNHEQTGKEKGRPGQSEREDNRA